MSSKPVVALALPTDTARQMFRPEDLERLRGQAGVIGPVAHAGLSPGELSEAYRRLVAGADVAITGWGSLPLDAGLLGSAPRLRLIAHSAGSVKGLVDEGVYDRGIRVTNAAGVNAVPVAQFTVALMVSLLKQVPWIGEAYRRDDREELSRRRAVARELQDLNIGMVSASRIGREVLRLLRSYPRLKIKLYDPLLASAEAASMGVELASLEDVCRCDVVTIHAPKLPETHHMFDARRLALLPDHAVLINTSRGALIDEAALVAELHRRPLYVALDVTDPEPPARDSPLRSAPNLLLTPHIAGAMNQARLDMGRTAIDETLRFLRGEGLNFEVTRVMLPTQA